MKKILFIALGIIFGVFSTSCTTMDSSCRESTKVVLQIGFYLEGTTNPLPFDSMTIVALKGDSIFYNNRKNISRVELPLDYHNGITRFAMRFNEKWDTLSVLYSSEQYFISYACGMIYTHQLDTVLLNGSVNKRVKIPHKLINTENVQHIQIYR
jgi:hypothetical protein